MNFLKSVFTDDDPDPPTSPNNPQNPNQNENPDHHDDDHDSDPGSNPTTPSGQWSFGGLIKTLQVKSDWIDTYRRDLQEFGSGLKKETEVLREVASKAVKDLPNSIDIGASKAQISLESVGQAFDSIGSSVWKSTTEIISHGKDSLLNPDFDDGSDVNNGSNVNVQSGVGKYSRFDAQLRVIQCDLGTYVDDPDDVSDYNEWKRSGFDLDEKREEIEGLMRENGSVDGIYKRVVPDVVDHEVFWCRYFYRVYKLKQAENVRARLVKRAISTEDDEEELSWDVDDDDEEEEEVGKEVVEGNKVDASTSNVGNAGEKEVEEEKVAEEGKVVEDLDAKSSVSDEVEGEEKRDVVESGKKAVESRETSGVKDDELPEKLEEKVASESKTEASESSKDSDISVVSTQPSQEEDDMGWDEIEDIGSGDEKNVTVSGSSDRAELRKRLSAADEDEDLSWDIEDDD